MPFGFFEEGGAELPHAPIPLEIQLIAEDAIRLAWQRLRSRVPAKHDVATAEEDELTHDLYEILFDEVFAQGLVEGFDRERFTVVTREKKVRNYDGTMLDKMPDLHISLAARESVFMQSQDGLFVECKPVDENHTVGLHYGSKGIARFLRGEYAWAMPEALMIGYTSPGYALDPKLLETLRDRATDFAVLAAPVACSRSLRTTFSPAVHISRHRRNFNYVETGLAAPPIQLRHLWLDRS